MTPPDEAPEQRWRRTLDRRNRPAKLKVDRLLRDFGYAELDPEVGDAIEARLAAVALAVAPSLRDALAGEVVTIYANDSALQEQESSQADVGAADPVPADEPAVAADVAQMVSYLKQQVFDARAEAERLRTELEHRIAGRLEAEREKETVISEQAAALEEQRRQIAKLGAALDVTRAALAQTRDEIRRAVGELQALPGPALHGAGTDEGRNGVEPVDDLGELEAAPEPDPAVEEPDLDVDEPEPRAAEPDFGLEDRAAPIASSTEWLPPDLEPQPGDRAPAAAPARSGAAAEPEPGPESDGEDRPSDFDDFLYEGDELHEGDHADAPGSGEPFASEIEARWPEAATVLPPPPPAPPSPWAGDGDSPPAGATDGPTLGNVLRGRGGRGRRGRWEGSCSICGRLPLENRRKDLEAAGWDLDDEAAACPQCRGVG